MKALHKGILFDGQSAITKSSKTLKSKIINPAETEEKKINTPYFKPDHIRFTIEQRVQKQNLKNQGLLMKPGVDHLKHAGRIVEDLLKKHKQTKQKLQKLKNEAEKKMEKECPFQPQKKRIQKYVVPGNVLKRNQVWLNQKRRKQIQQKQSLLTDDLGQCTFSPTLISKKKSLVYLRSRSQSQSINKTTPAFNTKSPKAQRKSPKLQTKQRSPKAQSALKSPGSTIIQPKKDLSNIRYQSGKRAINNRINNMS